MTTALEAGRTAVQNHDWTQAAEALGNADRDTALEADDLELLGTAMWWAADPDASNAALERAFTAYSDGGRPLDAARVAITLAYQSLRGLNSPVGGAWIGRAQEILATQPEGALHARLGIFMALGALMGGNLEQGVALMEAALDVARRHDAAPELGLATSFRGMANVMLGDWRSGLADIDAAAASVSTGRIDLRTASDIYCNTIAACRTIGDLDRAAQWADEAEGWMLRNGAGGYPGICRVHRAELKMLRGHYTEAESEARRACDELEKFRLMDGLGYAHYAIGEVRLRMGDLEGAEAEFNRAYEYGHDAQPGLAALQLARGELDDARRSLGRALEAAGGADGPADRATRSRLLPVQVEIRLATGDLEAARTAVEELEAIAADLERPLFRAGAMGARGELLLGEDKATEAEPVLGQTWRLWQSSDLPYEAATARLHYARALAAGGDVSMARRDLQAVRSAFDRLGATRDVRGVDALLEELGGAPGGTAGAGAATAARTTRTFMFTDIVTSTDLVGLIGDEAWSELLRWHDRELRASIGQHGGEVVNSTGDGFFAAFERAAAGIDCAVDIQRRLVRHRREHGFAPWVRIGLHTAEATREGRDFSGHGVHVAARVGAAAGREEILASKATIDAAGELRFVVSDPRPIQAKGVREPVEVRAVEWR